MNDPMHHRPRGSRVGSGPARRLMATLAGTLTGLALVPAATGAVPRTEVSLVGASISCGDRVLTFTAGVQVGDLHRVQLGNGNQVVINDVVLHSAVLADTAGATYRVVGTANSTALVEETGSSDGLSGHVNVNLTVLGPSGREGSLRLRERVSRDGTDVSIDGGDCSF